MKTVQHQVSSYAADLIRYKARQLVGKAGFTRDDILDLEQEMTLDLLSRLPKFNPNKAAHNTFVARVIEHKISKMIRYRTQDMRDYRKEACSLNDPIVDGDGDTVDRAATIDQDEANIHSCKCHRTREHESDFRLDVSLTLTDLPEDLREVAELLRHHTIAEVARKPGMPRSTFYDTHIARLREIFEDKGLDQYI